MKINLKILKIFNVLESVNILCLFLNYYFSGIKIFFLSFFKFFEKIYFLGKVNNIGILLNNKLFLFIKLFFY